MSKEFSELHEYRMALDAELQSRCSCSSDDHLHFRFSSRCIAHSTLWDFVQGAERRFKHDPRRMARLCNHGE